jgi:hypothetical protein
MGRSIGRMRLGSCLVAITLLLSACTTGTSGPDPPGLTAGERTLHKEASNFNQTVAVPALLGAAAGAGLGAILCKKNKAACAGGGAAVGGLLGGGTGYLVAQKNTQAASREQALQARIKGAREDVAHFDRIIAATNGVIADKRREIRALKASYRHSEGALASSQQERTTLTSDIQSVQEAIAASEERVSAITVDLQKYGSEASGLAAERDKLVRQQAKLKEQLRALLGLHEGVPTS